ncbi:hypothetical protein pipiens_008171 [Culex pipiens pipiens]|uniref:Peptidase S1 domain-containing protein n=1 Tax=Culex pipiens pipiens TaxID=38569 RepID=A0ABD1DM55_CULPP
MIVNNRYVVTAANCVVEEVEKKERTLISFCLGLGEQGGEKICANPPVDVALEERIPHPGWLGQTLSSLTDCRCQNL